MPSQQIIEMVSVVLGIILSLGAIFGVIIKMLRKMDKIDKIDEILIKIDKLEENSISINILKEQFDKSSAKEEERQQAFVELQSNMREVSSKLDEVTEETRFNTSMSKADTEVLEALADHAIKTQGANGKVHRSLEMIEKLKFNNPKFS